MTEMAIKGRTAWVTVLAARGRPTLASLLRSKRQGVNRPALLQADSEAGSATTDTLVRSVP